MESSVVVAIVAAVVALASLSFAIYKHFSTRSFSRVVYEVSQMADYRVPGRFLEGVSSAPVSVNFESVGTKKAENIILTLDSTLNPTQTVSVFLNCNGNPTEDQIEKLELTHSEGAAANKKAPGFTKIRFRLPFMELELDAITKGLNLIRLGPWFRE